MWGGIIPIPYNYIRLLLKNYFTPIKGGHGPLCSLAIPVTVVQPGCVNGGQSKERSDREGGGCGTEIFWKFVHENDISCTLNGIIRGLVMWSDIYQSPTPPFLLRDYFTPIKGGGGMALCALSYASDGGAARICQREGQGDFSKFVSENGIFLHIRSFIRGSLCSGIDQFLYSCSFFILFLLNLFQGNIFIFLSFFFCFTRRSMGGGHGPLVHLSYSSNSGAAKICQRGQRRGEIFSKFVYETGIFLHIRYHY